MCAALLGGAASCTSASDRRPEIQTTETGQAGKPTPTPGPAAKLGPALAHMLKVIHAEGYQTSADELRKAADYYPGLRPVLVARPKYLGNGLRCANVFFFSDGHYVGRDSATCHLYPQINWAGSAEVSVVYPRYAKNDALCCPTPNPVRVIFRLVHGRIERIRGAPPGPPR